MPSEDKDHIMANLMPSLPKLTRPFAVLSLFAVVAAIAVAATFYLSAAAQDAGQVVARVDGVDIKAGDLALAEEEIGSQMPPMPADGKRDYLVTYVADMILVAKAAEGNKITEGDEFKRRLAYLRNKLLMETFLQSEAKAAVTDAAMQQVYQDASKQVAGEKELRARHILVATEDEAKAATAELKKGADFAELAKQKSKDSSAAQGGDLDYFTKDQMVPEFAEAAFKLEKGQVSEPIKTQFGWHIIKVEDKRDREMPPFDKVKEQIETYLVRRSQAELITKLREGAKIDRLDAKPAEPQKN
jgi:peptidyl-prolyl cis-trans isomerase C